MVPPPSIRRLLYLSCDGYVVTASSLETTSPDMTERAAAMGKIWPTESTPAISSTVGSHVFIFIIFFFLSCLS